MLVILNDKMEGDNSYMLDRINILDQKVDALLKEKAIPYNINNSEAEFQSQYDARFGRDRFHSQITHKTA